MITPHKQFGFIKLKYAVSGLPIHKSWEDLREGKNFWTKAGIEPGPFCMAGICLIHCANRVRKAVMFSFLEN